MSPLAERSVESLRRQTVRGQLRFLISDTAVFGIVGILSRVAGFFLLPLVVRQFSIAEYGLIDAVRTFGVAANTLFLFGLEQASARYIADAEDLDGKRRIAGEGLRAAWVTASAGGTILALLAPFLGPLLFRTGSNSVTLAIRFAAASLPFAVTIAFGEMLMKWHFRRVRYCVLSLVYSICIVIFTVVAVIPLKLGITGYFEAQLAANIVGALLVGGFCFDLVKFATPNRQLRNMIRYGVPLMGTASLSNLQPLIERLLLIRFLGLDAVALYSVAQSLSRFIKLPADGFLIAWSPFALATYKQDQAIKTFNAVLLSFTVVASALYLPTVLLAKPVLTLIASAKYSESSFLIAPIAFALFAEAAARVTSINIVISMRTKAFIYPYIYQILVMVIAAYALRPLGVFGFALAFLTSKLSLLGSATAISSKIKGVQFHYFLPFSIACISLLIGLFLSISSGDAPLLRWHF